MNGHVDQSYTLWHDAGLQTWLDWVNDGQAAHNDSSEEYDEDEDASQDSDEAHLIAMALAGAPHNEEDPWPELSPLLQDVSCSSKVCPNLLSLAALS
jgi:hypothetical protein